MKNASKMHSRTCFWCRNASKMPKNFRLRRAYCYRNPFSNVSKVYFFRACGGHHSVFVFYACLQGASTQAQNSDFLSAPATGPNHNNFCFMLVYRALLDKHKTLNFDHAGAKKTLDAFTKGISYFCRRLWLTNSYSFV